MRPVIGITSSYADERNLKTSYDNVKSVTRSGGLPIILANTPGEDIISRVADLADGLLISGGGDIDPGLFQGEEPHQKLGIIHPERDKFENALIQHFLKKEKPLLGICRGCQMLNIAAGGDMYQDIYSQLKGDILQHMQHAPYAHPSHTVYVEPGSILRTVIDQSSIKVNSFHHQAIRDPAPGFKVTAWAADNVIEAVEHGQHPFAVGIQWHPECMTANGDTYSRALFEAFTEACRKQIKSRNGPIK